MQADAQFAVDSLDLLSPWRAKALLLVGWSELLRGMDDAADTTLTDAARASAAGLTNTSSIALAGRAVLARARGDLVGADGLATEGIERLISRSLTARATSALSYAAGARTAAERGRVDAAREWLAAAHRLLPQVTHALPWMAVQSRLDASRAHLLLGEDEQAAALCAEVEHLLLIRPRLGTLVGQAAEVRRAAARREAPDGWTDTLTAAELRLLPLLTTHLSFREIADRLFVSRNTVKTQAISVYRKLGASSRSEAVDRAEALGLIELPARITPSRVMQPPPRARWNRARMAATSRPCGGSPSATTELPLPTPRAWTAGRGRSRNWARCSLSARALPPTAQGSRTRSRPARRTMRSWMRWSRSCRSPAPPG